jgi:hypothetical protein
VPEGATPQKFAHGANVFKRLAGKRTSALDRSWPSTEVQERAPLLSPSRSSWTDAETLRFVASVVIKSLGGCHASKDDDMPIARSYDLAYIVRSYRRRPMSRQLDNLKRLFCKLQVRYGAHDEMVLKVKRELDTREGIESGYQQGTIPYRNTLPGNVALRRRDVSAQHTNQWTGTQELVQGRKISH